LIMNNSPDDIDRLVQQIEEALLDKNLLKASAILESIPKTTAMANPQLQGLAVRINRVREDKANKQEQQQDAAHSLRNNDPDRAVSIFQNILKNEPNNSKALMGLQEARRKIDQRHAINLIISRIRKAREVGDLKTVREYCLEWLQLEPGSEKATEILLNMDRLLNRKREILVLANRGRELIDLGRFQEAIDLLEKVKDLDPDATDGLELIAEAVQEIKGENLIDGNRASLDEAQRLVARGHYESAMKKLQAIEDPDREFQVEITLLKRKAKNGIEMRETEKEMHEKLDAAMLENKIETAKTWLQMIRELNPETDVYEQLRLKLDPESYTELTK